MSQRETWWDIASFVLRSLLTLIAAAILVLEANGYIIDFNRLRIEKAGLLVLSIDPDTVSASLNGKELHLQRGQLTKEYFPDQYQLEVRKDGYQSWQHQVRIEKGHVALFNSITLFPSTLTIISQHSSTLPERQTPLVGLRLRVLGTELWQRTNEGGQLVTRLSVPITVAVPFDAAHIIYQTQAGIHVIDADGSNDQLLLRDDFLNPAPLIVSDGGKVLSVVDGQTTTNYRLQ